MHHQDWSKKLRKGDEDWVVALIGTKCDLVGTADELTYVRGFSTAFYDLPSLACLDIAALLSTPIVRRDVVTVPGADAGQDVWCVCWCRRGCWSAVLPNVG